VVERRDGLLSIELSEESLMHHLVAGHGPPLILLHGYAETSRMWQPILPLLAKRFTVIAPDLPEFPTEVQKLVVMDAFLPGVGEWRTFYDDPAMWHFRFNGPTPEALVQGRERIYFEHFWNDFAADKTRSIPEADRKAYADAYARPGHMRAAWGYFAAFPQTARELERFAQTKLPMPVLVIAGEKAAGDFLPRQMKLVSSELEAIVVKGAGHWLLEERPKETTDALLQFL
jgi:pimeloyl-ACP methyl ester carboxylesterase